MAQPGARTARSRARAVAPPDHRAGGRRRLTEATEAAIREAIAEHLADGTVPGVAVVVTDRERTLLAVHAGHRDLAARRPVSADTLFEIGSIGKTFTAIVILQLAEEGRLRLDDPVRRHLPWLTIPRTGDRITVHHLLSHTAGISAGVDHTPEAAFQVHALRRLMPGSAPGRRFHYSNVGYKVLGLVIEAVDGRPYPDAVRQRVLAPLGMDATAPAISAAIRDRLATGYEITPDDRIGHAGRTLAPATWIETATADGSIASTADDMARFARLLLAGGHDRVLSPAAFATMTTPVAARNAPGYGYGVQVRESDGRRWIGHGGGMIGYLAGLQLDPDAGVAAVVLQNGMGQGPNGLARRLVALVAPRPGDEVSRDSAAEVASGDGAVPAAAIAGRWVVADHADRAGVVSAEQIPPGSFEIVPVGDRPVLRTAGLEIALEPTGDDLWFAPDVALDAHLLHAERADEHVEALWHGPTRYVRAGEATTPLPDPPPLYRAYAGRYRAHDPWTPTFRVVLRGDRLWLTFPSAPDGFDDEQPLLERRDGWFRVGDDPLGPERIRFDTIVDGRALRAWLSGWDYYRVGD